MTGPRSPNVWEVRRRAREGLWEAPLCREGHILVVLLVSVG